MNNNLNVVVFFVSVGVFRVGLEKVDVSIERLFTKKRMKPKLKF